MLEIVKNDGKITHKNLANVALKSCVTEKNFPEAHHVIECLI